VFFSATILIIHVCCHFAIIWEPTKKFTRNEREKEWQDRKLEHLPSKWETLVSSARIVIKVENKRRLFSRHIFVGHRFTTEIFTSREIRMFWFRSIDIYLQLNSEDFVTEVSIERSEMRMFHYKKYYLFVCACVSHYNATKYLHIIDSHGIACIRWGIR